MTWAVRSTTRGWLAGLDTADAPRIIDLIGCRAPDQQVSAHLDIGDELRIAVDEYASAGYVWQLAGSPDFVETIADLTFPADGHPGRIGAPHTRMLVFCARQPGRGQIVLHSVRPWLGAGQTPGRTVTVDVRIGDAPPRTGTPQFTATAALAARYPDTLRAEQAAGAVTREPGEQLTVERRADSGRDLQDDEPASMQIRSAEGSNRMAAVEDGSAARGWIGAEIASIRRRVN